MNISLSLIPRFNEDYNFNDFLYSIRSSLKGKKNDYELLQNNFGNKSFFFTNTGRSSLYLILCALDLPKGSKIGVQLYTCTVVFDAIIKAGYIPCFIDIDFDNYTINLQDLENKKDELKAIIVTHTFGRPAEMNSINKIADDIPIIEDCAHSLYSEYDGRKTGTLGFASFFSLAKYICIDEGGMAIINDISYKKSFEDKASILQRSTMMNEFRHAFFSYLYSFLYHKPWYGGFAYSIGSYFDDKLDISNKKGFDIRNINNTSFNLFLKKLGNFNKKVELQRHKSHILINELKQTSLILPYEQKNTYCNYYLFPILLENKNKRDMVCEYLLKCNIDTIKMYNKVPALAKKYYKYVGDCPITENLVDRILIIPNHYSLNNRELLKIVRSIKRCEAFL